MGRSVFELAAVADVEGAVVTLANAKEHLRVLGADEDAFITRLIDSATFQVESALRRAVRHRRYRMTLPHGALPQESVRLPRPPFVALETVEMWNSAANAWEAVGVEEYVVRDTQPDAVVVPAFGSHWPYQQALRFTFTSGHSVGAAPPDVTQAVLDVVAHAYEHRGDADAGLPAGFHSRHGHLRVVLL